MSNPFSNPYLPRELRKALDPKPPVNPVTRVRAIQGFTASWDVWNDATLILDAFTAKGAGSSEWVAVYRPQNAAHRCTPAGSLPRDGDMGPYRVQAWSEDGAELLFLEIPDWRTAVTFAHLALAFISRLD